MNKKTPAALALLLLTVSLASCANMPPELVVMQNPKTGEVVQCRHDAWGTFIRDDVSKCVDGYTKAGWKALTPTTIGEQSIFG